MGGAAASFLRLDGRADTPSAPVRPWTRAEILAALANVALALAIVWHFHDKFWWAPDDGAYAYLADRLRNGAVLNRDLHDVHAGYVHFLHAFALDAFGRDLASLRYPLAALTVLQSAIVFSLLRPMLGPAAIAGGLALSALTLVQFLNPTANWYALFLAVVLTAMLAARLERSLAGLVAIGFVLAALFLFRQLSGVLVGMGVIAYLLLPGASAGPGDRPVRLARLAAAALAVILAGYLWSKTDAAGWLLYGLWPLAALLLVALRTHLDDARFVRIVAALAGGAFLAFLPLLLYHLHHGSLGTWWQDVFVSALSLTELDFFRQQSYARLFALAFIGATEVNNPLAAINGVFWLVAFGAPAVLGIGLLLALLRAEEIHPLPWVALFHALVSAHYAIPIYALFSVGLTLAGLLALPRGGKWRAVAVAVTLFMVAVGLFFHAAQPLSRGLAGTLRGERIALDAAGLPAAHIRMTQNDQTTYSALLGFIEAHAAPGDPILGLPMTPELYFLSGRNPPVRFVIAPLDLRADGDVQRAMTEIVAAPPAVIVFEPDDKYTTPRVRGLMERLRPAYRLCGKIASFELYARAACK